MADSLKPLQNTPRNAFDVGAEYRYQKDLKNAKKEFKKDNPGYQPKTIIKKSC